MAAAYEAIDVYKRQETEEVGGYIFLSDLQATPGYRLNDVTPLSTFPPDTQAYNQDQNTTQQDSFFLEEPRVSAIVQLL